MYTMYEYVFFRSLPKKPQKAYMYNLSNMVQAVFWHGLVWLPMGLGHWCVLMMSQLIEGAG